MGKVYKASTEHDQAPQKYTVKHKDKDVIWFLKNFNTFYTGIDSLGNKRVNYFNALKYFC